MLSATILETCESMQALEELILKAGGDVVARAAIFAEGDAAKRVRYRVFGKAAGFLVV